MDKNLTWKVVLIIVLVVVAAWTLFPPSKTLKPGIDLGGGTSLIYEIDAHDVEPGDRKNLSTDMITVLRRRIDPANIQNLIWRPQGNTRFEIQMPLASAEAREKRKNFREKLSALLDENINPATIMRSLQKPPEDRIEDFNDFAQGSSDRLTILNDLATAYDERNSLRTERDNLAAELETIEGLLPSAGLDPNQIKLNVDRWANLSKQERTKALKDFFGPHNSLDLLTTYVNKYAEWAKVVEQLTDPNTGKNVQYENAKEIVADLLGENIDLATIVDSLEKLPEERLEDFNDFALGSSDKLKVLNDLATAYDERKNLRIKRDYLAADLETVQSLFPSAGLDPNQIKLNMDDWVNLNEQQMTEKLQDFLGPDDSFNLLTRYVNKYAEWASVVGQLTDPETGKNVQYENAKKALDKLSLTEEQIIFILEMSPKLTERSRRIEELKTEFADRAQIIDELVEAFNEYRPFRGRLDDPADLQRMLKGAGILEFRILPTRDRSELTVDEMSIYVEDLKAKGPKFASDNNYVWCEIENINEWKLGYELVASFGDKFYVLASNKSNEVMLRSTDAKQWKLKNARRSQDQMGRRAIGFTLDERAGRLFGKITGQNIGRPLCILLDGLAVSAPNIQSRITTDGLITGSFSETEQDDMVNKLNAGSLPAKLIEQPISVKTIGPSIGADNRKKGIKAGFIGLGVVVLCMLAYYTLAGSIADMALFMNLLFVLATMALVRATFTLPGIAGMILTIGMSVDANVLIFERIREEQQKGSSLRIAIRNGYQRAFRTILDANVTTFITAAILYWVASEEIKGFAIVLMLGIASSMFTALFVTRVIFDVLLARRIIKDHLFMLLLIRRPNVNWMGSRPIFLVFSALLIAAGLFVFFTRDDVKNNKYDIEFTGGTSVQINLKNARTRQYVEDSMREVANSLGNRALAAANVYSIGKSGKQYEINTTETNKTTVTVTFPETNQQTIESITSAIERTQGQFGRKLSNLLVTQHSNPVAFIMTTSQVNKSLVKKVLTTAFPNADISEPHVDEIVNDAILTAFADELEIQQNLQPKITSQEKIAEELIDSYPELTDFLGGIRIECEIERAATGEEIDQRFKDLRFKPDMRELNWSYSYKILGLDLNEMDPNQPVKSFVYLSVEPEAGFRELTEDEWTRFAENETTKVLAAPKLETSLPRVTQIDPSVGAEAKTRALIAIVLSLFAIVTYIWIRFGDARYGLAAITALVHDVCITMGAVTACTYIVPTLLGEKLLIGDFKINLAMIAAFLTIIGYSLNDTIVVFDRIRENRRKARLNPQIITNSINQTLSRTLLTSFTTFIVVLIMYIFGGQGLRGFTFAIGFGIIIGTYSSIAIAAPVLLLGVKTESKKSKR